MSFGSRTVTVNQTEPCTVSFNTSTVSIDASGGQRQVILTTSNSSCAWSATSDQAWVHNITPSSGTAGATLTFTVDLNNSTQSRSATIRAGQATLTVSQLGTSASCTFSLGYTTQPVPANGGTYFVGLFASNESCARTAQSNASFITNVFPASGNGTANISYTVAPNTSTSPRSGTLTIAGQTLTVNQDGLQPSTCTEAEPNDFSSQANLLTVNVGCSGKISTSIDKDWFDIYVNSGTTITFYLQVPSGLDYDMALYGPTNTNSSQHWLDESTSSAGQPESITYTTTTSGWFAVQIYGYQGAYSPTSTYTITRTQ